MCNEPEKEEIEIEDVLKRGEDEILRETAERMARSYGHCPLCNAELAPLDGPGPAYCPNGCLL